MTLHRPTLRELKPIFAIVDVIRNTSTMVKKGVKPRFNHLILPSLATTYGPAIVMNSINGSFSSIKQHSFITYIAGFLLSLYLHTNKMFLWLTEELPLLAKVISTIDLIHSEDPTCKIIADKLLGFFIGAFITKLVLHRSMHIKREDIRNLALYCVGVYAAREYALPALPAAVLLVCAVPLCTRVKAFLAQRMSARAAKAEKATRPKPAVHVPAPRPPRRKASIIAQQPLKK